jgi:hypothetical protein
MDTTLLQADDIIVESFEVGELSELVRKKMLTPSEGAFCHQAKP